MKHEQIKATQEMWFKIPSFEKDYEMNKDGIIRSTKNGVPTHLSIRGNRVSLYKDGEEFRFCVDILYEKVFGVYHIEHLPNEEWKPIRGYEGYYMISNKGRILSERRFFTRKNGVKQFCKEQIIKPKYINSGYKIVNLIKNKVSKKFLVHRLVAEHFIPNPYNYEVVNHKDENRLNNQSDNLEWCSRSYNQTYGTSEQRRIATRLRNNNGQYGYKRKVNR